MNLISLAAWHWGGSPTGGGGDLKGIIIWAAVLVILAVAAGWGIQKIPEGIIRTLVTIVLVVIAILIVLNILFSL